MELDNIVQFLENKAILVTGASGFLAKIFVGKILRIQLKKLFLLIGATDTESAAHRLREEVTEKELFRILRKQWGENLDSFISEKICPIPGNTSRENLGINDSDLREEMWSKIDIVVNSLETLLAIGFVAAKLWASRDGLMLASSLGINKLYISLDAQAVISLVTNTGSLDSH